jgi:hypothetical protein
VKAFFTFIAVMVLGADLIHAQDASPNFQIGSSFERTHHKNLKNIPQKLRIAALSVAQFGKSTAFYIGKHNGKDVMVTTSHSALSDAKHYSHPLSHYQESPEILCRVFHDYEESQLREFQFNLLDEAFECKSLIAIYPEFELAFFEIDTKNSTSLKDLGITFTPPETFSKGEPLNFFSYSSFKNTGHITFDLGLTDGELCSAFINSSEVDYMENYHDLSKAQLKTPSIPVGCDVSPGDSGSPLLNSKGELLGLLWASSGSIDQRLKNESLLKSLLENNEAYTNSELNFVWKSFNYATSLQETIEGLRSDLKSCESVACLTVKSIIEAH